MVVETQQTRNGDSEAVDDLALEGGKQSTSPHPTSPPDSPVSAQSIIYFPVDDAQPPFEPDATNESEVRCMISSTASGPDLILITRDHCHLRCLLLECLGR